MQNFDEVEIEIKVNVVIQKGKHKAIAKYINSHMESALEGFNYENLGVTIYNLETIK